jgi:hypothetical protein
MNERHVTQMDDIVYLMPSFTRSFSSMSSVMRDRSYLLSKSKEGERERENQIKQKVMQGMRQEESTPAASPSRHGPASRRSNLGRTMRRHKGCTQARERRDRGRQTHTEKENGEGQQSKPGQLSAIPEGSQVPEHEVRRHKKRERTREDPDERGRCRA